MLYINTVYAAVDLLYRQGLNVKPLYPPLVGQLRTDKYRSVEILYLWPLNWVENTYVGPDALATLWHPSLVRIGPDSLLLHGLEAAGPRGHRRWTVQRWSCQIITAAMARDFFKWDAQRHQVLPSVMPPSPPSDPDCPFD